MHHTIHTIALGSLLLVLSACSDRPARDAGNPAISGRVENNTAVMGAAPADNTGVDQVDDGSIVARLKALFAADPDISAMAIDIDSKGGMVTLSGVVTNTDAKVRADQAAKAMPEVKSVNNQLEVRAG